MEERSLGFEIKLLNNFEDNSIAVFDKDITFKNEISPRGVSSTLNIIADLIGCEYKMIIRKVNK